VRAAYLYGHQDLRIEDVPEPEPGPGQVKIRNAYTGICGSDLHRYFAPRGAPTRLPDPHPLTGATLPQVLGHEFSGTVVQLGGGVDSVAVGDRVAVWPVYYCGKCAACRKGTVNACRSVGFHGLSSDGGGLAEYTTVPADMLHRLPDSVDLRLGALVEPMAVAWHAVGISGIHPPQTALISGAGPIGIGLWFALRARGVETVVASEPSLTRRAVLQALGARHVVDPASGRLAAAVEEATEGAGVEVAFDAAGAAAAILPVLELLAPGGRLVVVALHEAKAELNLSVLVQAEISMLGAMTSLPRDFDAVITAMADGHYDTTGWVDEIGLDETVSAIGRLRSGSAVKTLVHL